MHDKSLHVYDDNRNPSNRVSSRPKSFVLNQLLERNYLKRNFLEEGKLSRYISIEYSFYTGEIEKKHLLVPGVENSGVISL